MKSLLVRWVVLTVAVFVAANIRFLGIHYDSLSALLVAALVLGIVNTFVKPVIMVITLPFILLSFGLLILLINASLFYFVGFLVAGFHVNSLGSALGGSVVVSIVSFLLGSDRTLVIERHVERRFRDPPPGRGPIIDL